MIWIAPFAVFFVGGPLIFRSLTRHRASRRGLRVLAVATGVFAAFGMGIRYGFPGLWGQTLWPTLAGIALIWFAWIGILAYSTQALRRADRSLRMKRLTGVIGALGTTMPWFGLASANMVWV